MVARAKTPLLQRLDESGFAAELGRDRFYPTVREAVDACSRRAAAARTDPTTGVDSG